MRLVINLLFAHDMPNAYADLHGDFMTNNNSSSSTNKLLIVAIVLILLCVIGFHLYSFIFGLALGMGAAAWGISVATIALFAIAALLFFILPGILIILISLFALGWVVLAIILFPFLFPLIMPVFIILVCIAFITRRKKSQP